MANLDRSRGQSWKHTITIQLPWLQEEALLFLNKWTWHLLWAISTSWSIKRNFINNTNWREYNINYESWISKSAAWGLDYQLELANQRPDVFKYLESVYKTIKYHKQQLKIILPTIELITAMETRYCLAVLYPMFPSVQATPVPFKQMLAFQLITC